MRPDESDVEFGFIFINNNHPEITSLLRLKLHMMYSQQEYDMVRRQTMQIEAEKRALLKWVLIVVSLLLAGSVILTGWMFRRYSVSEDLIRNADERRVSAENQLRQVSRELAEKKAIEEKSAAAVAQRNAVIDSGVPKMLSKIASDDELTNLARAINETPGHVIDLPGIPPDNVLRRYRTRVDGQPRAYIMLAADIDDKWKLYSICVKK
jgi:cell division protein YceG involved in septum cleavage